MQHARCAYCQSICVDCVQDGILRARPSGVNAARCRGSGSVWLGITEPL
jgi:hypothetical protein